LAVGEVASKSKGEQLEIMHKYEKGTIKDPSWDRMDGFEEVFDEEIPKTKKELFRFGFLKENLVIH